MGKGLRFWVFGFLDFKVLGFPGAGGGPGEGSDFGVFGFLGALGRGAGERERERDPYRMETLRKEKGKGSILKSNPKKGKGKGIK